MERDVLKILEQNEYASPPPARFFPNSSFVSRHLPPESVVSQLTARYSSTPITLLEGHILFNHPPLRSLCDLKFFLTLDEEECRRRRLERVYDPPNPPGFFDAAVWPAYLKRLEEVRQSNPPGTITFIDAKTTPLEQIFYQVLSEILVSLKTLNPTKELRDKPKSKDHSSDVWSGPVNILAPN